MAKTILLYFMLCIVAAFLIGCQPQEEKVYKVKYGRNYPLGAFKADIGNTTIFTNGPNVLEVRIESNPKFFCYAVNKETLCKFGIKVKINNDAADAYRSTTQRLKEAMLSSGKNRSTLPERLLYHLNDVKIEEEVLLINNLQNKTVSVLAIFIAGKGIDERSAKKDALKKSRQVIDVLIDKK